MRKIRILKNENPLEINFDDDHLPDIVGFNKSLKQTITKELRGFSVKSKGKKIDVNLENGDIKVDDQLIDLELDNSIKQKLNINNLRWINFNRKRISYRMTGGQSVESLGYGIGWQSKLDKKSIKRFVFVTKNGHKLEK